MLKKPHLEPFWGWWVAVAPSALDPCFRLLRVKETRRKRRRRRRRRRRRSYGGQECKGTFAPSALSGP